MTQSGAKTAMSAALAAARRSLCLVTSCSDLRPASPAAADNWSGPPIDSSVSGSPAALEQAIERSTVLLRHAAEVGALLQRYVMLSTREREVMELVISGRLNKEVAGELGLSEVTVKSHRGKLMRKMGAGSLAELVRMYIKLRPEAAT
jgi:DNA-binding CsgD family transcriptional regulator